jgi:hypothetical protein
LSGYPGDFIFEGTVEDMDKATQARYLAIDDI